MRNTSTIVFTLLLASRLASVAHATPILVYVTPTQILLGTNAVSSDGNLGCKLISNSRHAIIRASDITMLRTQTGSVIYDSKDDLWTALVSEEPVNGNNKIFDAIRSSGLRLIEIHRRFGAQIDSQLISKLESHLAVVSVDKGKANLELFDVSYSLPHGTATFKTVPLPNVPYYKLAWVDAGPPEAGSLIENGNLETLKALMKFDLDHIWKTSKTNAASFSPPYVAAIADSQGVHWLFGSENECAAAHQRALRRMKNLSK